MDITDNELCILLENEIKIITTEIEIAGTYLLVKANV